MPPADQWSAVVELNEVIRGVFAGIGSAIRDAVYNLCVQGASIRPVLIALSIAAPNVLWLQPPPQLPRTIAQGATSTSSSSRRRGSFGEALAATFSDDSFVESVAAATADAAAAAYAATTVPTAAAAAAATEEEAAAADDDPLALHSLQICWKELLLQSEKASVSSIDGSATEQAFSLTVSKLCVRNLPPSITSQLLYALDTTTSSSSSSNTDEGTTTSSSAAAITTSILTSIPPILSPLSLHATASVLLQTAPANIPWVTLHIKLSHLHTAFNNDQITALTTLLLTTGKVCEQQNLPVMRSSSSSAAASAAATSLGGADSPPRAAAAAVVNGGWFMISESRSLEGRTETHVLGAWACVCAFLSLDAHLPRTHTHITPTHAPSTLPHHHTPPTQAPAGLFWS